MTLLWQHGGDLLRQPWQVIVDPLGQRAVAKAGQIHQMNPVMYRQLLGDAVPHCAVHTPSVQQHQIGSLTKLLYRYAHLDSRSLFMLLGSAC